MSARIDPAVLLSDAPSFVVGDAGGEGLVCRLYRADPCCGGDREFGLEAQPARLDADGQATLTGAPSLDLRVGVDCGFLYYAEGGLADPAVVPILRHLDLALDGQALDALARRWLSERGETCCEGQRKSGEVYWPPGQPLAWEEVFEVLREDNLHGPLGCYAVFDLYFVEPGDESDDVILHFGKSIHGPTRDVGGVRVDPASGDLEMMPARASAKLLAVSLGPLSATVSRSLPPRNPPGEDAGGRTRAALQGDVSQLESRRPAWQNPPNQSVWGGPGRYASRSAAACLQAAS